MLNNFSATGRVAQKTVGKTALGAVYVKFTLAIPRRKDKSGEVKTDFIPCGVFGNSAKFFADYIEVGNVVTLSGAIQTSNYEKDGKRMTAIECFVSSYDLIPVQAKPAQQPQQAPQPAQPYENIPVPPVPPPVMPELPPPAPEETMPFGFYGY